MPGAGRIAHELGIAMRLGGRAMKRRLAAGRDAPQSEAKRPVPQARVGGQPALPGLAVAVVSSSHVWRTKNRKTE